MDNKLESLLIQPRNTVQEALKKLNINGKKILLVIDESKVLIGTLTDGDIRTFILTGKSLQSSIAKIYNRQPVFLKNDDFSMENARDLLLKNVIELIPITDESKRIIDYITWNQAFSQEKQPEPRAAQLSVPVVIMAGGMGTRLEPFTKIFPKPLIPIGDKPVIEIIIDEFRKYGAKKFYLTLNYKGEMIRSYFRGIEKKYKLNYISEPEFLGTAGSLKLLADKLTSTFIVSNCDVIIKNNFSEALEFHKSKKATLTILSVIQNLKIPYGVIQFKSGGTVKGLLEKPEYSFTVSSGVYILEKKAMQFIPANKRFDMPELIQLLLEHHEKVLIYPINEADYIDIGQWDEFKRATQKLSLRNPDL